MVEYTPTESKTTPDIYWQEVRSRIPAFVRKVTRFAEKQNINIKEFEIDHVGLRFRNPNDVDFLCKALDESGTMISRAFVNGREIFNYRLDEPIEVDGKLIWCVEVPYPTEKHDFVTDGLEHMEVVIPSNAADIASFYEVFHSQFPDFEGNCQLAMPRADREQLPNPTVIVNNPNDRMCTIKFHPHSIEEIVSSGQ